MRSLVRLVHNDEKIAWPFYGSIGVNCFSQVYNDALGCLETESRVDNLAIANLHSYPSHVTAIRSDDSVKCLTQRHNKVLCLVWVSNMLLCNDSLTFVTPPLSSRITKFKKVERATQLYQNNNHHHCDQLMKI